MFGFMLMKLNILWYMHLSPTCVIYLQMFLSQIRFVIFDLVLNTALPTPSFSTVKNWGENNHVQSLSTQLRGFHEITFHLATEFHLFASFIRKTFLFWVAFTTSFLCLEDVFLHILVLAPGGSPQSPGFHQLHQIPKNQIGIGDLIACLWSVTFTHWFLMIFGGESVDLRIYKLRRFLEKSGV